MRRFFTLLALLAPLSAKADAPTALGPHGGKFGAWTAAIDGSGADQVCYAFTEPQTSSPSLKGRGLVMLTVTERQGLRDALSITPGYSYPKKPKVSLSVGKANFAFYVDSNVAFGNDSAAALAAFAKAQSASVKASAPHGKKPVIDQFSLTGFTAAYRAIEHACP